MIRFFDILLSSIAIIILFPLMLPVMLGLKLTGEHYIFYKQIRIGCYGKEFNLLKFATMLKNSPNLPGGLFTSANDPRLMPLGNILRKTKINELPQLINIFIGQMSFVGYRPMVREHYNEYSESIKNILFNFKPGLTSIGSIVFRNEEEILQKYNDKDYVHNKLILPYKGALECWYLEHCNLLNYFKIIFVTVIVILRPESVFWRKFFQNLPPIPAGLLLYLD
jgi:lipopolysaccharide/colanic/teichoic acid biosynthesis glycosyltransferase